MEEVVSPNWTLVADTDTAGSGNAAEAELPLTWPGSGFNMSGGALATGKTLDTFKL